MVTATRRLAALMMPASERATSRSEGERPSRSALVESQIIAVTPSAPSSLRRASSIGAPISGVASIFQSPVWRARPWRVRTATALGSGIECATEMSSRLKGPTSKRLLSGHLLDGQLHLAAELRELGLEHRRRERGCIDRHPEPRPQLDDGADVVLVRVGQHEAGERAALLLDEAQVGQDHVDAGVVLALREGDAEIDHQPLARIGGPKAVEIAVHADLADAAERHEHELAGRGFVALVHGHPLASSCARSVRHASASPLGGEDAEAMTYSCALAADQRHDRPAWRGCKSFGRAGERRLQTRKAPSSASCRGTFSPRGEGTIAALVRVSHHAPLRWRAGCAPASRRRR